MIDKQTLLEQLRTRVASDLRRFITSQHAAQADAIHEETRQEDPKDTRAIEATYLARGLAERVESMRTAAVTLGHLQLVDFGPDDPHGYARLATRPSLDRKPHRRRRELAAAGRTHDGKSHLGSLGPSLEAAGEGQPGRWAFVA